MVTLRHTRYQAAVLRDGPVLLVRCAFRDGPTVWMLPGGGREEDEDEVSCVTREVLEETGLQVRVERLLFDRPAEPPDGTYIRWRTYLCTAEGGEAAPGGGEGSAAELIDVAWISVVNEGMWPSGIVSDVYLYPQLQAIRSAVTAPSIGV